MLWWVVPLVGIAYFVLPLLATFQVSLGTRVPFRRTPTRSTTPGSGPASCTPPSAPC
ncbi:MAG: hypothetical protein R3C32_00245 [Chloroflexota bacterium]